MARSNEARRAALAVKKEKVTGLKTQAESFASVQPLLEDLAHEAERVRQLQAVLQDMSATSSLSTDNVAKVTTLNASLTRAQMEQAKLDELAEAQQSRILELQQKLADGDFGDDETTGTFGQSGEQTDGEDTIQLVSQSRASWQQEVEEARAELRALKEERYALTSTVRKLKRGLRAGHPVAVPTQLVEQARTSLSKDRNGARSAKELAALDYERLVSRLASATSEAVVVARNELADVLEAAVTQAKDEAAARKHRSRKAATSTSGSSSSTHRRSSIGLASPSSRNQWNRARSTHRYASKHAAPSSPTFDDEDDYVDLL
jgi:predicted XRE-type DNA-binding protein